MPARMVDSNHELELGSISARVEEVKRRIFDEVIDLLFSESSDTGASIRSYLVYDYQSFMQIMSMSIVGGDLTSSPDRPALDPQSIIYDTGWLVNFIKERGGKVAYLLKQTSPSTLSGQIGICRLNDLQKLLNEFAARARTEGSPLMGASIVMKLGDQVGVNLQ